MKTLRNRLAFSCSKTRVRKENIMQPDKYPQAASHTLCQEGDRVPCLCLKQLNTSTNHYLNGERISLFLVSAIRLAILFGSLSYLRTVPTFVTAYTVCASRDTRVSYGWCLLILGYFCAV